jgi:hypothetical protein
MRWLTAAVGAAVALTVLTILLSDGGTDEGAADRPAPGDTWSGSGFFGTNAPLLRAYTGPERTPALSALAASIAAARISWVRLVFDQAVEQRRPGETDWSVPDRVVGILALHGVRTQAVFVGTAGRDASLPAAIGCGPFAYPADVDAWSSFVGDSVERYGPGGAFWTEHPRLPSLPIETWEIGNEENLRIFWCPGANPEQYAEVFSASRAAAHSADDDAHVIVGGLAPTFAENVQPGNLNVADFLRRMIAAKPALADQIPAVGVHLYAPTAALAIRELRLYRQAMAEAGLAETPMIVNEAGWHTMGPHDSRYASEAARPELIGRITAASRRTSCNVVGFGIHTWVSAQADPGNPDDWYGLADPSTGVPNGGGRAYAAAIAADDRHDGTMAKGRLSHLCG